VAGGGPKQVSPPIQKEGTDCSPHDRRSRAYDKVRIMQSPANDYR